MECIIVVGVKLIGIGSGNITLQVNVCNHVRYSVLPLVIELVLVEGIALVEDEGILIFSLTETPDSTNWPDTVVVDMAGSTMIMYLYFYCRLSLVEPHR